MKILPALQRWRWLALAVAGSVLAVTVLFLLVAPRSYTASSVVAVVPNEDTFPGGELVSLAVPTYASLATSESLAATIAEASGEDMTALAAAISADVPSATNTVVVSVRWSEPERAAELTNRVTQELVAFSEEDPILTAYIVAPAVPPVVASFPPLRAALVGGVIGAVILGVAVAVARQAWDERRAPRGQEHTSEDAPAPALDQGSGIR